MIEVEGKEKDFWDSCESAIIRKMKEMDLQDLINLLWTSIEVKRGSEIFFKEIENQLTKKILKIKDEEF